MTHEIPQFTTMCHLLIYQSIIHHYVSSNLEWLNHGSINKRSIVDNHQETTDDTIVEASNG